MLGGGSSISSASRQADETRGANVELMPVIRLALRLLVFTPLNMFGPEAYRRDVNASEVS